MCEDVGLRQREESVVAEPGRGLREIGAQCIDLPPEEHVGIDRQAVFAGEERRVHRLAPERPPEPRPRLRQPSAAPPPRTSPPPPPPPPPLADPPSRAPV